MSSSYWLSVSTNEMACGREGVGINFREKRSAMVAPHTLIHAQAHTRSNYYVSQLGGEMRGKRKKKVKLFDIKWGWVMMQIMWRNVLIHVGNSKMGRRKVRV